MNKHITKIIAVAFLFLSFAFSHSANAATTDNVYGQAWSANTGFINFNNCLTLPAASCAGVNYGVRIDVTNAVSGSAWSNNIGWVKFSGLSSCPSGSCNAMYNPVTGAISGWARACAGTVNGDCASATRSDGWDGWISLSSSSGVTYGANLNKISGLGSGQAWGSDVVGWIDFSGVKLDQATNGACGTANGVAVSVAPTPSPATPPNNLCTTGTQTAVSGTGPWTWSCNGSGGGTNANCSAPLLPGNNPIVTTNPTGVGVTSITPTSACLPGGNLNINGSTKFPMNRYMEWSPNSNMSGNGTLNAGSTSTSGNYTPFSCTISGLTPNTTYYYRAAVVDSALAKFTGAILSFTTGAVGNPIVTTGAPSSITATSAILGGHSVNINGSSNVPLALTVEYGTNPAMPSGSYATLFTNPSSTSTNTNFNPFVGASGLTSNTTYYVRAVATYNGVTRYTGAIVPFTTLPGAVPNVSLTPWCSGSQGVLTLNTSNISAGTSCSGSAPWTSVPSASESKNVSQGSYSLTCGGASSGSISVPACPGGPACPTCPPPPKKPRWWEF